MIETPLTTVTDVAAVPPSFTVAPVKNPVPVIVTLVPPAIVPAFGEMLVGLGGGLV